MSKKNRRKPIYDSEEDRKKRTVTKSQSALMEQREQYRDASASPAEARKRRLELYYDKKLQIPEGAPIGKIKGERQRDLARLAEIAERQRAEEEARARKVLEAQRKSKKARARITGGGGTQSVKQALGLTGPNPFAKRLAKGGSINGRAVMKSRGGTFKGVF
tara:strand:- start:19 stop:504 length:486 start_codon:yes stop_codon:yes gene_type:complete